MSNKLFISAHSHTHFILTLAACMLPPALLVKGERYQRRHRLPLHQLGRPPRFTSTVNEPNDVCLHDCISQYAVQYGF